MSDVDDWTGAVHEGDAFDLISDLPDDYAHAAVVDYPWQFEIKNGTGQYEYEPDPEARGERGKRVSTIFSMEPDEAFPELIDELNRVLVDGAWALFFADDRFQDTVRDALRESEMILRRNWAWTPGDMGMGFYGRVSHYPIPVATNGETDRYVQDRGTLYTSYKGREVDYPTGKPVDLYWDILAEPVIKDGERLLEPFCGSAPGAAVASGRRLDYWGCDVDADAVERARSRLEQSSLTEAFDS